MTTLTLTRNPAPPTAHLDNRLAYAGFALAYLFGHGGTALTVGPDPVLDLPRWIPLVFLVTGLAVGTVAGTAVALRAQRTMSATAALPAKLLGLAWVTGFAGLFLAITGIVGATGNPGLSTLLWPTGSGVVVGLIYLAEGAHRRDVLHYLLGTWLVLVAAAALLLPLTTALTLVALAGGGGYVLALLAAHVRRAGTVLA